jgi:membrane fusion protein, heavy metal efflux system
MRENLILAAICVATAFAIGGVVWVLRQDNQDAGPVAVQNPGESKKDEAHEPADGGESAHISAAASKNAGLVAEVAGPASIEETVNLTGRVVLNQNRTAMVKARFPGIIRSIHKVQGDMVKEGEVLATVESNDSLQVYSLRSPIAGTILARNGSVGDVAGEGALYTVADISELWVELHVFAQDAVRVKAGLPISISSSERDDSQDSVISAVLPVTESSSQTLLARATVKNLDSHWLPGMSVNGDAVVATSEAAVAVKTVALQRVENRPVVFVQNGEEYRARRVVTGASDDEWTEIKEGLNAGEKYVSQGSFTVKAELGKSEAEHEH